MKNEETILEIVKEDHKMLINLNREVGEIKSSLRTRKIMIAGFISVLGIAITVMVM